MYFYSYVTMYIAYVCRLKGELTTFEVKYISCNLLTTVLVDHIKSKTEVTSQNGWKPITNNDKFWQLFMLSYDFLFNVPFKKLYPIPLRRCGN